jgi:prephenate dehydrogenase
MPKIRCAAIIGTGLIGGSLGLALKALAGVPRVTGCARRRESADKAKSLGAIDEAYDTVEEAVKDADIVFLATPVNAVADQARKAIGAMKPGAILTDTASVKAGIVMQLDKPAARAGIGFIGGHPMAGSELSGIDAASKDLFKNAAYILTPTEKTDPEALKETLNLIQSLGARVFTLNPDAHDRVVATISHLPHVLSAALVNIASAEESEFAYIFKLAAGGFYDMTRVAGSSPDLWSEIVMENRTAIAETIHQYQAELETMAELLSIGDAEGLRLKLANAKATRQDLPRLKPEEIPLIFELTVGVPNHPKVLSDITLCVANLGVNIEDIQIVHSTEADSGLLKLAILGEKEARKVVDALEAKGYQASLEKRLK